MECTQLQIDAQDELAKMCGYNKRTKNGKPMRYYCNKSLYDGFYGWKKAKKTNIMTFRDQTSKNCFEGNNSVAPLNPEKWKDLIISSKPYATASEMNL